MTVVPRTATASESPADAGVITYPGIAYRQSRDAGAPWIVTFVCSAEELNSWAGIPQRTDQTVIGFQRPDDPVRVEKAKAFFELGINQSPTAIVVGIHPPTSSEERKVRLEFEPADEGKPIRRCKLHVAWDVGLEDDIEAVVRLIRKQLTVRMQQGDGTAAQPSGQNGGAVAAPGTVAPTAAPESDTEDEEDLPNDQEEANDEEAVEEEPIELGRSLIEKLLEQLDNREWCEQNIEALRNMARPATIIDGQHRIRGAERCEREIPFTVCAIYDCPWSEQIFQFTVVNYTARGIPDQFITANAALSLTRGELEGLKHRLYQAGVKVVEYDLMRVVNFDPRSPFYERVNLGEKKDPEKIGYKTMVQLAKAWYSGKHHAIQPILNNLYPSLQGPRSKRNRLGRWMNDDWGDFFMAFWDVVHSKYATASSHDEGHTLWDVGYSNLLIAVVLVELQNAFLEHLSQQDEEFFEVDKTNDEKAKEELRIKLKRRAEKFLEWIPPTFFGCRWGTKSLNTGAGRTALAETIESLVKSKGKFNYPNSTLVKGKAEKGK
jgi:hypothetical protein